MVTRDPATQTFFTMEEAAACIEQLLLRAEAGEKISIMREGRVVVELAQGPERQPDPEESAKAWEKFKKMRAELGPIDATLEEMMAWRHETNEFKRVKPGD